MPLLKSQQTEDKGYFRANVNSVIASRPIVGAKVQITDENNPNEIIEEIETDISARLWDLTPCFFENHI